MLLFIDNFDSFTYNLVQQFQIFGVEVKVVRNNALKVAECLNLQPDRVVIGPGPGSPVEAGISQELIVACFNAGIPLLGVCMGHQCLANAFGATVQRAIKPMHGMVSSISHTNEGVLKGLPNPFAAARYHSLSVEKCSIPAFLKITAYSKDGEVMALQHQKRPLHGVQFHPESIATPDGARLLSNFTKEKKCLEPLSFA
ncbi:Anthranilate synthase component 2 [Chlamydiales bacterium STE3]|nr:Anthranilate synthase component 2 [Chlamydiales bacterium STE3]